MSESSVVLVVDGHDGSGKTTLASRLAKSLGANHVQPYSGIVGRLFLRSIDRKDFRFAGELARQAVDHFLSNSDAPVVIFDRHWMTAFSVSPEAYWSPWQPLPPTALCWADIETTLSRLHSRQDHEEQRYDHKHFLSTYWKLGQDFGSHVVRTDKLTLDESLEDLLSWAEHFVKPDCGSLDNKSLRDFR